MNSVSQRWLSRFSAWLAWPSRRDSRTELVQGFWVLCDQAIVSLANFSATLIIGRVCLPAELGLYALGFSLAVFLGGIPKALVWSPYTAFYPHMKPEDRAGYTGSATMQLMAVSLLTAAGLLLFGGLFSLVASESRLTALFLVLSPYVVLMMLREHVRRLCLAWLEVGEVLALDAVVSVVQVAGLVLLAQAGWLSCISAYVVATVASAAAIVWLIARGSAMRFDAAGWQSHLRKHWDFARWLFAGAVAALACQAIYRWGLAWLHGWAEVGLLASAQSVILLANPIMLGLGNYCGPAAAALYARDGRRALFLMTLRSSAALLAFVVTFFALIVLFGAQILTLLFGPDYSGQEMLVVAIGLGLLSEAMLIPSELALLAINRSDFLFKTALVRLAMTLTVGIGLMAWFSAPGVGYAMLVVNIVTLICEWHVLRSLASDD